MTLQAPEFLREDFLVKNIRERAAAYMEILASELSGQFPSIHLVGFSFGGPLAFEMALCAENSGVKCSSISMIDPTPYGVPHVNRSNLQKRASYYDDILGTMMPTNLEHAVSSKDITCVWDLEQRVLSIIPGFAREASRIVNCMMILCDEIDTRDLSPEREIHDVPSYFFKADDPEFFPNHGYDREVVYHPDGVYGWSVPLNKPDLKPIFLEGCMHMQIASHEDSLRKVASMLAELLHCTSDDASNPHLQAAHISHSTGQVDAPGAIAHEVDDSDLHSLISLGQQGGSSRSD
jgi:hypothetical protein